jgi:hypothetical protein
MFFHALWLVGISWGHGFKAGLSDVEVMVFYALYVFNIQSIV